jgi:protein-S-isoprenylcysteine O-methyltransferase Ste14
MEKTFVQIEDITENIKAYLHTKVELAKLNAAEKGSNVIANIIAGIIVMLIFFLCFVFAGIAFSLYINQFMNSNWIGFLIIASVYLLIGLLVWVARTKLLRMPIMNSIIQLLLKNSDEQNSQSATITN